MKQQALSLLFMTVLSLVGCRPNSDRANPGTSGPKPAAVRVQVVEFTSAQCAEELVGTVRARLHATIEAKQSGRIEKFAVALGDKVRAGDLIARLDLAETAARLEQAQASLEQAEREWKRISSLFEQQSATRAERDDAEARVRRARAGVGEAKALLAHGQIIAPFEGVVSSKWAEEGDLAAPGKPLVDLQDPNDLQVELDLPEHLSTPITPGSEYGIRAGHNVRAAGILREVAPALDPRTRTRRIKLQVSAASGFIPGQFVRVSVPVAERKALVIPRPALIERGQLQMVFTIENERARMRLVKSGKTLPDGVEILSGIEPGDRLVVEGAGSLLDGQAVEVK